MKVLRDPGILTNTRQTGHEHNFKRGIVIGGIIGMPMLASETGVQCLSNPSANAEEWDSRGNSMKVSYSVAQFSLLYCI